MRRTLLIAGMGLSGLLMNRGRTALTMLGIVIGVAAVVVLTSLGNGVQKSVSGQIEDLGPELITVSPGSGGEDQEGGGGPFGWGTVSTLTLEDSRRVADLSSVDSASPRVSIVAPVGGQSTAFTGVAPSYKEIRSVGLAAGRFVEGEGEMVLASPVAEEVLGAAPEESVGRTLEIDGEEYEVVGVAEEDSSADFGPPTPETSYLATGEALGISGSDTVGQIVVKADSADSVESAADEIEGSIQEAHGGAKDFSITTQQEILSAFTEITNQLQIFLAGIAGISLLVGGIGVMNIMLVSVTERRREIGVRKALGATDSDILLQFLLEAVLLALLGGLVGIAVGIGGAALLPEILEDLPQAVFTGAEVGLAFGVSALIGVVFGVMPAYRSARLQPVEALRSE